MRLAGSLTTDQLQELLPERSENSINVLHKFGLMLLDECLDRSKQLDAKATSIAGFSGVIVAILVAAFSGQVRTLSSGESFLLMAGGACVVLSCAMSLYVLSVRPYEWFSDKDWFVPAVIDDGRLQQAHLLTIHRYKQQHGHANEQRALRLKLSYVVLGVGMALLLLLVGTTVLVNNLWVWFR